MVGALIMGIGAILPWARATGVDGQVNVFWDNNLLLVLAAIVTGALAKWLGAVSALPVAAVALVAIVLVMYELPGTLMERSGFWQAEMTWGAYIALLGAVVALGASLSDFSARLVAP
ncbi:hypothetical protein LRS13_16180 [Svornostia abyssi]|uniref:Uncharacterized protein n=1 Tax=Svornostia abyssi TaxID=2898438 RepID=A0ABY5PCL6_9ACTN|nr:hypothetical protein LRS13_16180 [Parviterribacteraceae bacterium J379]